MGTKNLINLRLLGIADYLELFELGFEAGLLGHLIGLGHVARETECL